MAKQPWPKVSAGRHLGKTPYNSFLSKGSVLLENTETQILEWNTQDHQELPKIQKD